MNQESFSDDSEYWLAVWVENIAPDLVERACLGPTAFKSRALRHFDELEYRLVPPGTFWCAIFSYRIFRFELCPLAKRKLSVFVVPEYRKLLIEWCTCWYRFFKIDLRNRPESHRVIDKMIADYPVFMLDHVFKNHWKRCNNLYSWCWDPSL